MAATDTDIDLKSIYKKLTDGERLNREDGIALMGSFDILSVGSMADYVRKKLHGDRVYFTCNMNINPTNICINRCSFCAFSKPSIGEGGWRLSLDELEEKAKFAVKAGVYEFHIVGGLNPESPFEFYLELIRRIKYIEPSSFIQAFTAVELDYFSRLSSLSVEDILLRLKDAGLGSIPGGGAEVFSPRVRKLLCPNKVSGERWLEIHRIAHRLGINSNATMLYGHIETDEELIEHLLALRDLQDETGGFLAFVPLAFHSKNTHLSALPATTGFKDLKVLAVARLMLDNFSHIRLLWSYVGENMAQVALSFGVDDIGGTNLSENIARSAGAQGNTKSFDDMLVIIRNSGKIPTPVNSRYETFEPQRGSVVTQ